MKQVFFFIAMISLVLFSCDKPSHIQGPGTTSIEGKWRMITVQDVASGITTTRPASIQGDVDISFTPENTINGTFNGNTPTNTIAQNEYSIGVNQAMSIPNLSMTKVMETTWGDLFVKNIRNTREYNFDTDGRLHIKTTTMILTFRKL